MVSRYDDGFYVGLYIGSTVGVCFGTEEGIYGTAVGDCELFGTPIPGIASFG